MGEKKHTVHLNIFLVKEGITAREKIIRTENCDESTEIAISGAGTGYLYWKRTDPFLPKWVDLFKNSMEVSQIGRVVGVAAVFLTRVSGRLFVLSFGQSGRFLIEDDVVEERFGLLVALNSVDRESFRCVDKQSLDAIQSHTRIQSGQATTADQFGLDVEQDMLKAIVGAPVDSNLGSRMSGAESLSVSVKMDLGDLPYLLASYKEKYEHDLSKTDYAWVNNISVVKGSSALTEILNDRLIDRLVHHDYSNLWLAIPEIIDWDLVTGFIYTGGKKVIHPDVDLKGFLSTLKDGDVISIDLLKRRHVHCADADHNYVFKHWSVFKCLYAEVDYDGKKYILNDGKWFSVDINFVKNTNLKFNEITASTLRLPVYAGGGEGKYNQSVSERYPNQFALLDDKNKIFHGGGHGQIEVCDLFSIDKQLIHIKRYGKSSVFSHLFSQGFVSGQLLQIDPEFRRKAKEKLAEAFKSLIDVANRPKEEEFTIVFGVISEQPGNSVNLPFFSRVNLNNTYKVLRGYGYNVELLKIGVDPDYAMTKKCPPG